MTIKYLYIILVAFIYFACQQQRPVNRQIINNDLSLNIDSSLIKVDKSYRYNIIKYTYYNSKDTTVIDSIKMYYVDTKTLASVEYRPDVETADDKWIRLIEYDKAEKIQNISYDYKKPKIGDTIKIFKYPDGITSSVMIYARDGINYPFVYEYFHQNGIIAEKGIYDVPHGLAVRSGLWQYFDSTGVLTKTENYFYPEKNRPYWIESKYYDNGIPKSEKQFYHDLAGESDILEPKGIWKYYDETGKLTKTEKH